MAAWPEGVQRAIFAELDSTNAEALRRAAQGEGGRAQWILALKQLAARGRRGRAWSQPAGNFGASLLLPVAGSPAAAAQRSFVAALGLHDALVDATGRAELFALKWPNDVLLTGRKLAGILLETGGPLPGGLALVIGFGVNLRAVPEAADIEPDATRPISLLEGSGIDMRPEEFLDLLAPAVAHWEARLQREGFGPVRAAWLGRAARLGEPITARLPARSVTGRFETIDATGALVLVTPEGRVVLPAGDVFFGTAVGA